MTTRSPGLLASPTVPTWRTAPPLEAFETVGLTELDLSTLRRLYQLRRQAIDAVAELRDHRPGGESWRTAETADSEAVLADKKPTRVAKLLASDADRWAAAHVACLAFGQAAADKSIELRGATVAAVQPRIAELEQEFKDTALAGWHVRADRAVAWQHRQACEKLLDTWQVAVGLTRWASGGGPYQRAAEHPGGEGGGAWVSLAWLLDGKRSWLVGSGGAALSWPEGADEELWNFRVSDLSSPQATPNRRYAGSRWS